MDEYPTQSSYGGRHAQPSSENYVYTPPPVTGPPPVYYAPGPDGYPEPAYATQPPAFDGYAQQQYAPQQYAPQQYGVQPVALLPAPKSRLIRPGYIVAAVVVAVLVAGGVLGTKLSANSSSGSSGSHSNAASANRTLTFPATFDAFALQTDQTDQLTASDLQNEMASSSPAYAKAYANAKIGIYASAASSTKRLIVIGLSVADMTAAVGGGTTSADSAALVDGIMAGAKIPDAIAVDAGAFSGTMRCGTLTIGATGIAVCAWADQSTIGLVMDATAADRQTAAATTLALRNASEH